MIALISFTTVMALWIGSAVAEVKRSDDIQRSVKYDY